MEDSTFEDVIEKLLRETEIGVSAQLETREGIRKGTLSLLSISTATTVFIFDIIQIGQEVFKWGLRAVLTNPHCVKITHDSRLLREAFDFDDIILLYVDWCGPFEVGDSNVADTSSCFYLIFQSSTEGFFSDILLHQYAIQMYNTMDTMAAHLVFASRLVNKQIYRQGNHINGFSI